MPSELEGHRTADVDNMREYVLRKKSERQEDARSCKAL